VVAEAVLQSLVGLAIGVGLGLALLYGVGSIDLSALSQSEMGGFRLPEIVVLQPTLSAIVSAFVTVLVTALAGGLWPAWKAARLNPVDAMRSV
ncbi:FtsX-like permease family protein, partial [Myxococcota bacterium]